MKWGPTYDHTWMQAIVITVYEQIFRSQSPWYQSIAFIKYEERVEWKPHVKPRFLSPQESLLVALFVLVSFLLAVGKISWWSHFNCQFSFYTVEHFSFQTFDYFFASENTRKKKRPICLLSQVCFICLSLGNKFCPIIHYETEAHRSPNCYKVAGALYQILIQWFPPNFKKETMVPQPPI